MAKCKPNENQREATDIAPKPKGSKESTVNDAREKVKSTLLKTNEESNKKPEESTEAEKKTVNLSESTTEFLGKIFTYQKLISPKDPACRAIDTLMEEEFSSPEKKAELLSYIKTEGAPVNPNWELIISEIKANNPSYKAKTNPSANELDDLLIQLKDEEESIKQELELIKNQQQLTDEQSKDRTEKVNRLRKITLSKREINAAKKSIKNDKRLSSPKETLGLMIAYLNRNESNFSLDDLVKEVDRRLSEERDHMRRSESRLRKAARLGGSVNLKTALKSIASDKRFSSLGENPEEELVKLAKFFTPKNQNKVKDWFENLPGNSEEHLKTTLPTLMAYLEFATANARVIRPKVAEGLLRNLKKIRDEHFMKQVYNEHSDPEKRMLAYLKLVNQADEELSDIIITDSKNPNKLGAANQWALAKSTAKATALGTGLFLGAPYVLGGTALVAGIKYRKKLKAAANSEAGKKAREYGWKGVKGGAKLGAKLGVATTKRGAKLWLESLKLMMNPFKVTQRLKRMGEITITGK